MTYEIYKYMFVGASIFSIMMFFVSVIIFIRFQIAVVLGELTGFNARKSIREIRNRSELNSEKQNRGSAMSVNESEQAKVIYSERRTPTMNGFYDITDVLPKQERNNFDYHTETERFVQVSAEEIMFKVERDITYMFSSDIISKDLVLKAKRKEKNERTEKIK